MQNGPHCSECEGELKKWYDCPWESQHPNCFQCDFNCHIEHLKRCHSKDINHPVLNNIIDGLTDLLPAINTLKAKVKSLEKKLEGK